VFAKAGGTKPLLCRFGERLINLEVALRRKISLLVITCFVTALAVINHGCSRSGGPDSDDGDVNLSFDLNDPKIKERLGEDDGYALAIMYGADIHGSLETCG
jgi:hypothetical protein